MLPIEFVTQEAERQGLDVKRVRLVRQGLTPYNKWLLIEGRRCQAIPARLFSPSPHYPANVAVSLNLPRTRWPEFLIYVVMPSNEGQKPSFYVVPRGALSTPTGRMLTSRQLKAFQNAWDLLSSLPPDERTTPRFRQFSFALKTVLEEARLRELKVAPVYRSRRTRYFAFQQHRICIEGRQCHVMTAPRISDDPRSYHWKRVLLKAPKDHWGEFVIYVVNGPEDLPRPLFIVPRSKIGRTTTSRLSSSWLGEYQNAWHLISSG